MERVQFRPTWTHNPGPIESLVQGRPQPREFYLRATPAPAAPVGRRTAGTTPRRSDQAEAGLTAAFCPGSTSPPSTSSPLSSLSAARGGDPARPATAHARACAWREAVSLPYIGAMHVDMRADVGADTCTDMCANRLSPAVTDCPMDP